MVFEPLSVIGNDQNNLAQGFIYVQKFNKVVKNDPFDWNTSLWDREGMNREKWLSALDIAKELNTGKALVKFMLKRFHPWLPCEWINGRPLYRTEVIRSMAAIQELLDAGTRLSEIETLLETQNVSSGSFRVHESSRDVSKSQDIRLSRDGLTLIKSLLSELGVQQQRIAEAHEKRAMAEERKAVAIEKRAEAEEKKAEAMNHIASALQEMNRLRVVDPSTRQIAREAARALVLDEDSSNGREVVGRKAVQLDDLSLLVEMPEKTDGQKAFSEQIILDDLSLLIDAENETPPMDDLSLLINGEKQASLLDDLALLLDPADEVPQDDLALLLDPPEEVFLDDLSALVDDEQSLKIDISPDQDLERYKAAVMKIILELKEEGKTARESADLFNRNRIQTLSGRPEWSEKAMARIYQFIAAAQ